MGKYNHILIGAIRDAGYKNGQVAEMCNIEQARFSRILNGIFNARPDEKRIIAKILRKNQKDLF